MEILDAIWIYDKQKEATVIRASDAKKRRVSLVSEVQPYFFIKRADRSNLDLLPTDSRARIKNIYDNGEFASFDEIPTIKLEVDMPSTVRTLRDKLESMNTPTFESNVPFIKRWMIDGGHKQCPVTDIAYADIEVDGRERWGTVKHPSQQVMSISIVDNNDKETFISDTNERALFQEFVRLFSKKYHLVTGWNWNDYDWPYLVARMRKLGLRRPFIPIQRLDAMTAYKRFIAPTIKSEVVKVGLDDCGLRHLGIGKTEKYDAFKMYDSFVGDKERLRKYNMQDSRLVKLLNEKLHLLDPYMNTVSDFNLPLSELERMSYVWESLLMTECLHHNPRLVIPRGKSKEESADMDLQGGNILPTVPGYHANTVLMDYKGLYPSMMRLLGISPEYVYMWQKDLERRYKKQVEWAGTDVTYLDVDFDTVMDYSNFVKKMIADGYEEPMFRRPLSFMQNRRDDAKGKSRAIEELRGEEDEEYIYWNAIQLFYKTVLVSSYGVSGLKSGKFFMPNFVNLLTFSTRNTIQHTKEVFASKGWMTTYGHTDSCMIRRMNDDMNIVDVIKGAYPLADEVNQEMQDWLLDAVSADENYVGVIKMKPEKISANTLLSKAKTKKIMDVIWSEGHYGAYRFIGGAESIRVDTFPLLGRVQNDLVEIVFKNKSTVLGAEWGEYMDDLKEKLYSGFYDNELVISKSLGREIDEYDGTYPQVRIAKKLMKLGKYRHGEKVNYVVISKPKGKPNIVAPVIEGEPFPRLDLSAYKYYLKAIERLVNRWAIYEASQQMSLEEWVCSS